MTAVFDASVLVKLVVSEPGTAAATDAYGRMEDSLVPDWALLECAHALWRKAQLGQHPAEQMRSALGALGAIGLRLEESSPLASSALALALETGHAPYDCLYVALAHGAGAPLVTADAGQAAVAAAAGVEVVWIDSAAE